MTSIERTAYPRFGRLVTSRELAGMSPSSDEVLWARGLARSEEHLLALVLSLKCFQRLGYFPRRMDVPDVVADHLRGSPELAGDVEPEVGSERTVTAQHQLVRERVGVVLDRERAGALARDAIRRAAWVKNNPPDLINVALEILVKASLELPGFSTLNAMAAQIRAEVNTALFEQIVAPSAADRVLARSRLRATRCRAAARRARARPDPAPPASAAARRATPDAQRDHHRRARAARPSRSWVARNAS